MSGDILLVIVVGTALAFDFTNGFHDTANVVATSISTGAANPQGAVAFASRLDFAGDRLRRVDRGDHLEPRHLVLRAALELLARADRRRRRLRRGGLGLPRDPRRRAVRQGPDPGGRGAASRLLR